MTLQKQLERPGKLGKRTRYKGLWFERLMAIVALVNLGLVAFDYSYVPWRNFYLRYFPALTQTYDRFEGIEPHRLTEAYLDKVRDLENQVALTGLQSPQSNALLAQLREMSTEIIDENPFAGANKSGTLERIKRRMRDRTNVKTSSKQAFNVFWSQEYLTKTGWSNSIDFFNKQITPLIKTNYYRGIGENGEPIDLFWKIDSCFIALFAVELLIRTFYLSRRYKGVSWLDAIIWRWYDLLLLLPFWRWLRVVPVVVRLDQSKLVNLAPLNNRIVRSMISGVAVELTEIIVIRVINQAQAAIRQGDIVRWMLDPDGGRRYIDLNGVNEVEVISKRLTNILVYQVLPKVKPEVDAFLHHSVTQVLSSSPAYASLQRLPGIGDWSNQLTQQLVSEISQNTYRAIAASLEDEVGATLIKRLVSSFGESFRTELQQQNTLEEIRSLTIDLLDEVKLNYVQRIAEQDLETLRSETTQLYELTQGK